MAWMVYMAFVVAVMTCQLVQQFSALKMIRKKTKKLTPSEENNKCLQELNSAKLYDGITYYDLLKRPEITMNNINKFIKLDYDLDVLEQIEIKIKYEGYIKKANKEAEKMLDYENIIIPKDILYQNIPNIASEARQKLEEIRPISIGQATRISGVNPSDITMLMIYIKRNRHE